MTDLGHLIDEQTGFVRTESFDMTFGELINLHSAKELIINPEYQRLFRWEDIQKSRFIESILLKLPIPEIYIIENQDGVYELIDGLQRISSVIQFMDSSALTMHEDDPSDDGLQLPALTLTGCDIVTELNGLTYETLPIVLKLRLKRSSVRTIVINRYSSHSYIKYTMFKRLHTGGSKLEPQEIRNCVARMTDQGVKFYEFLKTLSSYKAFQNCIFSLPEVDRKKKGDEELVLRFWATKNAQNIFKNKVTDWLDDYMEQILLGKVEFEYEKEKAIFEKLFSYLSRLLGSNTFVRYQNREPHSKKLAPAYYEAVTVGVSRIIDRISILPDEKVKEKLIDALQSKELKENTGSGANRKTKLEGRINAIQSSLMELFDE